MSIVYKRVVHFSMHGHHTCPAEVEEKEVRRASTSEAYWIMWPILEIWCINFVSVNPADVATVMQ